MKGPPVFNYRNDILDAFSAAVPGGLDPAGLRSIILQPGHIVGQPGDTLDSIYFPQSALISAVMELSSGESMDGILIGSEGVFGAAAAFGIAAPVFSSVVQRAGTCWLMSASELRRLVRAHDEIAALLFRYQYYLLAQAQQIAACATKHHVRERFCTYLLRVQDDGGEIRLIQEHLARTLGVQRTSISLVAGGLQSDGIIRYQRGRIKIIDPDGLRAGACECHHVIEGFKHALLESDEAPVAAASSQ